MARRKPGAVWPSCSKDAACCLAGLKPSKAGGEPPEMAKRIKLTNPPSTPLAQARIKELLPLLAVSVAMSHQNVSQPETDVSAVVDRTVAVTALQGAGDRPAAIADRPPIDIAHLSGMTQGNRALQSQVLELFDRQAELLLARMQEVTPAGVAGLAHTLAGSARAVGAWRVAEAAEALERAVGETGRLAPELMRLTVAVEEAQFAIRDLPRSETSV
jgi:HPt (histidine-containing phosphotransfer) domain-containing protein